MFWITMRQYMQERREARSHSAVANMIAPLQVTVGTATGNITKKKVATKNLVRISLL